MAMAIPSGCSTAPNKDCRKRATETSRMIRLVAARNADLSGRDDETGPRNVYIDRPDRRIISPDGDVEHGPGDNLALDRITPRIIRHHGHPVAEAAAVRICRLCRLLQCRSGFPCDVERIGPGYVDAGAVAECCHPLHPPGHPRQSAEPVGATISGNEPNRMIGCEVSGTDRRTEQERPGIVQR